MGGAEGSAGFRAVKGEDRYGVVERVTKLHMMISFSEPPVKLKLVLLFINHTTVFLVLCLL